MEIRRLPIELQQEENLQPVAGLLEEGIIVTRYTLEEKEVRTQVLRLQEQEETPTLIEEVVQRLEEAQEVDLLRRGLREVQIEVHQQDLRLVGQADPLARSHLQEDQAPKAVLQVEEEVENN